MLGHLHVQGGWDGKMYLRNDMFHLRTTRMDPTTADHVSVCGPASPHPACAYAHAFKCTLALLW